MRKSALFSLGLVVAILVALGLVVLSSASEANALRLPMCRGDLYYFFKRQVVFVAVGVASAIVVAVVDYRKWRQYRWLPYLLVGVVIVLLACVFLFPATKGSHRWIPVGFIRLQPSEFAKLAVVIWMASWLDRQGWKVELFKNGVLIPSVALAVIAVPVVLEPDFGSTAVMCMAAFTIMFMAGVRIRHAALPAVIGILGVAVMVALNPNRMARITAFLGDDVQASVFRMIGVDVSVGAKVAGSAADAAGYQAYNALVAISNGGIWGVGLNQSMQKHYYLPEAHTDFILAIGAEELGLPFSIGVLVLFIVFFLLSVHVARKSSDRFGRLLVMGMAFLIFAQAMANVGVVCEAFPTKGLALPFFSYGGTNMISTFIAVGTIFSVGIHSYRDNKRKTMP